MEKKVNDNRLKNLIPFDELTENERRELASKAGKASVKKRREKKTMRELLALAFEDIITNPTTNESKTRKELAMARLAAKCANGDLKAIELAAKLAGEFKERHELTGRGGDPIQLQAIAPQPLTTEQIVEAKLRLEAEIAETTDTDD